MNTSLFYGLILAAANIVLGLIGFFLGFQTDRIAQGQWFSYLSYVLVIVVTWLGIRAAREEKADKSMSYGRGVGAGVLINLYSNVLTSIYGFFHFTFINTSFADYMMDFMRKQWAAKGMSDAQMEGMEKFMRHMFMPVVMSITGFIYFVIAGLVVALIVSAFLKRAPAADAGEATPAT